MGLTDISVQESQLLKGLYGDLLKSFEKEEITLDQLWIMSETYIELNMVKQIEDKIKKFKGQLFNPQQRINYFYSEILILKENGEFIEVINLISNILNDSLHDNSEILFIKFNFLLIECKIIIGDLENIEDKLNSLNKFINKINQNLYIQSFKSTYSTLFGNYYLKLGDYDTSLSHFLDSLQFNQLIGNPNKMAKTLIEIGKIYSFRGQLSIATDYFKQALDFWEKVGNLDIVAQSYLNLGRIQAIEGNQITANEYFDNGLDFANQNNNFVLIAEFNIELLKNANNTDNIQDFNKFIQNFPSNQEFSPIIMAYNYIIKALIAQQQHNFGQAREYWHKAIINEGIDFEYQLLAHEALAELSFKEWLFDASIESLLLLEDRLDAWEMLCMDEKVFHLSKIYLMRAKFALSSPNKFEIINLNVAEEQLDKSLMFAEQAGLKDIQKSIQKELIYVKQLKSDYSSLLRNTEKKSKEDEKVDFENYLERLKTEFKNKKK